MRYAFYVVGLLILTLGISFTIQSNLGTSPFDALLVGLSRNVGLTVGSWEIILAILLIGSNALIAKQKPEIVGLITAFITGIGIDMWLFLLRDFITPDFWYSQAICFGIGLIVTGLGTATYLHTNFAPIPVDRLTILIKEMTKKSIFFSRTIIYVLFLVLAMIFKGPIGVGTLLTVCLGGFILHFFMPIIGRILDNKMNISQKEELNR
ncbi:YczE/YyaS/YitT family protein [Lysinibacillus sp. FW12]|uniref:YczE/YyaS/YitT family protein n=1 Tax=Lysinibacillus sp. FW12 TaxID=3096079 RepID=UPI003D71E853